METPTDYLGLSNETIFRNLSTYLNKKNHKTRSLMDCADSMLFIWNCEDNCLWALNCKAPDSSVPRTTHQTLVPTNPPSYEVERLKLNRTSSFIAAFGSLGVAVIHLPRRWGKWGLLEGGKAEIMCRSRLVDERYFRCHPHVVVKQVRWHPGSSTDSLLLVLSSENTFRLYEVAGSQPTLLKMWTVGRRPSSTRVPILVGLGDTCVDFDFSLPVCEDNVNKESKKTDVLWPVYALQGNGDVYLVRLSCTDMSANVDVIGPLRIFPQSDDNYGGDACSILCLQTNPPIVIVATSSGTIYHSLVLASEDDDGSWNGTRLALYVFESVELELGLGLKEDDDIYACPILLYHDITSVSRYFCSHDTGVHVMLLSVVSELERYILARDEEIDMPMLLMKEASTAQYLLCTRTSSSSPVAPVQALTIGTSPPVLICLLITGEVVSVPLTSVMSFRMLSHMSKVPGQVAGPEIHRESFQEHVKILLHRNSSQPLMKLAPSAEPSSEESLELLSRATNVLMNQYIHKQVNVCDEMQRKVRMLRTMKDHQLKELSSIEDSRQQLKDNAEHLAEKYEDIKTLPSQVVNSVGRCMHSVHGSEGMDEGTSAATVQNQPVQPSACNSAANDTDFCPIHGISFEDMVNALEDTTTANKFEDVSSDTDEDDNDLIKKEHELRVQIAMQKLRKMRLETAILERENQRKCAELQWQEEAHRAQQRRLEEMHKTQMHHTNQMSLILQRRFQQMELHVAVNTQCCHTNIH